MNITNFDFEIYTLCRTAQALGFYTNDEFVHFLNEISTEQEIAFLQGYGY